MTGAWIFAGIALTVIGDLLRLLPIRRSVPMYVFPLAGYLALTIGFNLVPPPVNFSTALFAAVVVLLAGRVYRRITDAASGLGRPLLVYTVIAALALLSGLSTLANHAWSPAAALPAAAGMVLLAVSDIFEGWDRYVHPAPRETIASRICRYLGGFFLAAGALWFS